MLNACHTHTQSCDKRLRLTGITHSKPLSMTLLRTTTKVYIAKTFRRLSEPAQKGKVDAVELTSSTQARTKTQPRTKLALLVWISCLMNIKVADSTLSTVPLLVRMLFHCWCRHHARLVPLDAAFGSIWSAGSITECHWYHQHWYCEPFQCWCCHHYWYQ